METRNEKESDFSLLNRNRRMSESEQFVFSLEKLLDDQKSALRLDYLPRINKSSYPSILLLPKRSRDLLFSYMESLSPGNDLKSIILHQDHLLLGFKHKNNFYRYRKHLIDAGLIVKIGDHYMLSPTDFLYLTRSKIEKMTAEVGRIPVIEHEDAELYRDLSSRLNQPQPDTSTASTRNGQPQPNAVVEELLI